MLAPTQSIIVDTTDDCGGNQQTLGVGTELAVQTDTGRRLARGRGISQVSDHDLVMIGAGAKAAAIAAKVHVLNELGLASLNILIIEHHEPGAMWTGKFGFTAGSESLGTRPEKDIGFPYESSDLFDQDGERVDAAMMQYSWQRYLMSRRSYSRWIDSGLPPTTHTEFAYYLKWIFSLAVNGIRLKRAKVTSLDYGEEGWTINCTHDAGRVETVRARLGVIVSGPGLPKRLPVALPVAARVVSAEISREALRSIPLPIGGRVCIVGTGESAGALALFLLAEYGESISVRFVSSSLPYSRLETYLENSVYSAPELVNWVSLPEQVRQDFIRRTDRGVMSPDAVRRLVGYLNVSFSLGRVSSVKAGDGGRLGIDIEQPDGITYDEFDLVVNCTGFSPLMQIKSLLSEASAQYIENRLGASLDDHHAIARLIDSRLALSGLTPSLHIPALAGLANGPGFANLSCLGSLSNHILAGFCLSTNRPMASEADEDFGESTLVSRLLIPSRRSDR